MNKKIMADDELYLASETKESKNNQTTDTLGDMGDLSVKIKENDAKSVRIPELNELRSPNCKVFGMSDGTKQAVFYPEVRHVLDEEKANYVEIDNTLDLDANGRCYTNRRGHFVAKFCCEEKSEELFVVEKGKYRVRVSAKKNHKDYFKKAGPVLHKQLNGTPERLVFENISPNTDFEYQVSGRGVKENIVVKERKTAYRFPFLIQYDNVVPKFDEKTHCLSFYADDTGAKIFFIPSPFMMDANGSVSSEVIYEVKEIGTDSLQFTVIADNEWLNEENRAYPVLIDPQIEVEGQSDTSTYSWYNGQLYSSTQHTIGTTCNGDGDCNAKRMYMTFNMPELPRNPRIKKAELTLMQKNASCESGVYPKFGIYQVTDNIRVGECTPYAEADLLDYHRMSPSDVEAAVTYTFDITTLVDEYYNKETWSPRFVLKMLDENNLSVNSITLYGSASLYPPELTITYEDNYAVNGSYRTRSHEIGRFGQGSVDLAAGNLMFESDDFVWAGNRMPITIKHLYNSALASYHYTQNSSINLHTANFESMKVGKGWKLNLMQSMMPNVFQHDGTSYQGFVYINENGESVYFKESAQEVIDSTTGACYRLYEDIDGSEMYYDQYKKTLTIGNEVYLFDDDGRLIRITDENGNRMMITYTSGRITSITDGVNRDFGFSYNANGNLISISAPDGYVVTYEYDVYSKLTGITYPGGKRVGITYSGSLPAVVTLYDDGNSAVHKVAYTFNRNRVSSVKEYGVNAFNNFVLGTSTYYSFSAAASRTSVRETNSDGDSIKTVYTFDNDGNVISEYAYSGDTGNVGVTEGESGIDPNVGGGYNSNVNNLLVNHNFEDSMGWINEANDSGTTTTLALSSLNAKFAQKVLKIESTNSSSVANGVYQTTEVLPEGQYTFSTYICVAASFSGNTAPGAYIRVTDTSGNVLAESEHIRYFDDEYIRLHTSFELATGQRVIVHILVNGQGIIMVDGAQLEKNPFVNTYNMLENGDFERGTTEWSTNAGVSYSTATRFSMNKALMAVGDLDSCRLAYQDVQVKSDASTRETFTLSAWACGHGLPNYNRNGSAPPKFEIRATVFYTGDVYSGESYSAQFSPCTNEWQYASLQFSKAEYRSIDKIRVYCDYSYNVGVAYFDNVQLVRDSLETNLSSSDFDTVTTYSDTAKVSTRSTTTTFEEAVDTYGNQLTETTFADGVDGTIYRSFGYDANGNNLIRETDPRGNKTYYSVDEDTSRTDEITDRCGNKTAYTYDAEGNITCVTSKSASGTTLADVFYSYDGFGNVCEIMRGDGMKYSLIYNRYHNLASIGIEGKNEALISYDYKNEKGIVKHMVYANGDCVSANYNSMGQMVSETWNDADGVEKARYKYVYDGVGNLNRSIDIHAQKEYNYVYEDGKILCATELDITLSGELVTGRTLVNTIRYTYNSDGALTSKTITSAEGSSFTYSYSGDNVTFTVGSNTVTAYSSTDALGRKTYDGLQLGTGIISRSFVYHGGMVTEEHVTYGKQKSTATTQLVKKITFANGRTLEYEYDAEERITKVTDSEDGTTEYTYDALGQLLTEKVNGMVVTSMTYDNYGNILTKNGIAYTYDSTWKDLLTSYNGQSITYDAQGNPTMYLGHTLTWGKGRQLQSFDNNTYTYNANGIRTSKTVNGVKHTYTLDGAKILRETWGANTLIPLYDSEESVCGIVYNSTPYYFLKNLQGDIIAMADRRGTVIAEYTYDAWGKCTIISDCCGVASVNPYRYRGYYYDTEIELYYLQSRYYDHNISKFINSDDIGLHFSSMGLGGYSTWHYCYNDPLNFIDECGYASTSVKEKIKSYAKETWIAWILNKFINRVTNDGRLTLIRFNKLGLEMQLFLEMATKKGYKKPSKSSIEASFKGVSFKLGWGGKLEATLGLTISNYTVSFMRGVDWRKSYFSIYISYVTKDGRLEFTTGLYVSIAHLLKLAIAVTVVGVCVVLPTLSPVFMSALSALSAKTKILVSICSAILNGLRFVTA